MGDFLSQHSSPNHGLWEAMRVSTHPPEKVGGRKEHYFLEFMYVDVARDFVDVAFHAFLDDTEGSNKHRNCLSTSISKSLYLLSFSVARRLRCWRREDGHVQIPLCFTSLLLL